MSGLRRVGRGSYVLDGEPVASVTTIINNGVPKPALVGWAANATIDYAEDHWEELLELKPSERRKRLSGGRFEAVNAAGKRGTEIHDFARRLAAGEEVEPPEELIGHVDAYLRFVEEWRPEEILVEAAVGNREFKYAGTLDVIARLADGLVWLLDWKTAIKGVYTELALQLAAYRYCEFYVDGDDEKPMPTVDRAGGIHVRADGYELVPVEADETAWRLFLYAQQVARFTQEPRERYIGEGLRPPLREVA